MGNGFGKITGCLRRSPTPRLRRRNGDKIATVVSDPYLFSDEGLGHSFCYVRPVESQEDPPPPPINAAFRAISGASVSANTSTAPFSSSTSIVLTSETAAAAVFDSSESFFSVPLQPVPRLLSGPLDRGFLSGPIERGFMSGPIDPNGLSVGIFSGPLSAEHHAHFNLPRSFSSKPRLLKGLGKVFRRTISRGHRVVSFSAKELESAVTTATTTATTTTCSSSSVKLSGCSSFDGSSEEEQSGNLHWAQGKAGEDRVHVVVSEEEGWVFVGIYDGFNGPDATDYLLSNLYHATSDELKGVSFAKEKDVLDAMKEALRKTENGFLGIADKVVVENPELALMGSCVLVMVLKGEDVYLMNVGDSRAVVGRAAAEEMEQAMVAEEPETERISMERTHQGLEALQLTVEHSTCVEEELRRIRNEHPEDANAIVNDRVKGSLKVTRAFGAGFLKKPKWNDALLEMFRVDYIGNSPYITCDPSLSHHKLDHRDRFLILSSDGLYQYLTNEEAAAEVEAFMAASPEGDPAQHLIEEVLFRAAKKAGLDFHELLEIPQGDRRRYHDDVSVIVISLEGRIWRSSM